MSKDLTLEQYEASGAFDAVTDGSAPEDGKLRDLLAGKRIAEFLRLAVRRRKNILISGGTSAGKTTLLNSLLAEVPRHERLILRGCCRAPARSRQRDRTDRAPRRHG